MAEKKTDSRVRTYATVVYPDSAPDGWKDNLNCIPCFISPLHDKDINPTGEQKKPHWHVLFAFENKKSDAQIMDIINKIGGVGCESVISLRGYARYLCHLDNPEKAQYEKSDVISLGGVSYLEIINIASDKGAAISEMEVFCEYYDVVSFYALSKYARKNRPDWHRILMDCGAFYMDKFLKSRKWSNDTGAGDIIDPETGEVIS